MSSSSPLPVTVANWPKERKVLITFSPTRTVIRDIAFQGRLDGTPKWTVYTGLSVEIARPSSIALDGEVKLDIAFAGEPLSNPHVRFLHTSKDANAVAFDRYERIHDRRQALAEQERTTGDRSQRYLFDLDRQTNNIYLCLPVLAGELEKPERDFRIHCAATVGKFLGERTKSRMRLNGNGEPYPFKGQRHHVAYLSALFVDINGDGHWVGAVLERFAAGSLGRRLTFDTDPEEPEMPPYPDERISEPNSWAIFQFAEFAVVCIEMGIDIEFWKSLLCSLVKMQGFYAARFETVQRDPDWSLDSFGIPPEGELAPEKRNEIERWHGDNWDPENSKKAILHYLHMLTKRP